MDFNLSNDHKMVQAMVRNFVQQEVAPVIKEIDVFGSETQAIDQAYWQMF